MKKERTAWWWQCLSNEQKNRAVDSICLDDSHYEYVYVFVTSPAEIKHEYYEKPPISVEIYDKHHIFMWSGNNEAFSYTSTIICSFIWRPQSTLQPRYGSNIISNELLLAVTSERWFGHNCGRLFAYFTICHL